MKAFLRRFFDSTPDPTLATSIRIQRNAIAREAEKDDTIRALNEAVVDFMSAEARELRVRHERESELREMMFMAGAGPWRGPGAAQLQEAAKDGKDTSELALSEAPAFPAIAQGAYGDAELMLNNIEWKREVNLSWLEFTRWGIQQIILIARLRCIKDPMLKRGMNVSAQYVFGRGVQISSPDQATNELLTEWRERNKRVLGQVGLTDLERAKFYDGNLFFICFTDATNTGDVNIRTIDATEITDVVTDPDDSSVHWYYERQWTQAELKSDGTSANVSQRAWYPALNFEPDEGAENRFEKIRGVPVQWGSPVYHRKCAAPMKWHFGLPEVYAALSWGDSVKRFLQDCMTIRNALAQFSMILTSKGGQQALQGAKSQLSTTVGPNASLWDQNPPAVAGSIFASGPGTTLQAFNSKGAGGTPDDVRQYKLMVAMCFGLPESFFADMNTSNLATATSLDRPTELNFMERQEVWVEDLTNLALYQIRKAKGAAASKFREALKKLRQADEEGIGKLAVIETPRVKDHAGRWVYEASSLSKEALTVRVEFPAIIEADVPARVGAIVEAMTLGGKFAQVVGIDQKEGTRLLNAELGVPESEENISQMFPDKTYDPDRTKEPEPAPIDPNDPEAPPPPVKEAFARLSEAFRLWRKDAA